MDLTAEKGLRHTPKNVSGAIISTKASYAERIQVLLASWKIVTAGDEDKERGHEVAGGRDAAKKETAAEKKKTGMGSVPAVFHNSVTDVLVSDCVLVLVALLTSGCLSCSPMIPTCSCTLCC